MVSLMARAATSELVDVECREEGVQVGASVLGANAEEGCKDDGQEGAVKVNAAREVFGVLLIRARRKKG